jgi:hypothetical protein
MMKKLAIFGLLTAESIIAAPLIEDFGGLKVDWSNQVLQFTGTAAANPNLDWKNVEIKALESARTSISQAAETLFLERNSGADPSVVQAQGLQVKQKLKKSTYSRRNEYGSDGALRLSLESKLIKVLLLDGLGTGEATSISKDGPTGIILKVKGLTKPQATFKISEASQGVVFAPEKVNQTAYQKNLMGRWFKEPLTIEEQTKSAGLNPLTIDVTIEKDGVFKVSKADWDKVNQEALPLLKEAKVAILLE